VFGLCQIHAFIDYVRSRLSREQFTILFQGLVIFATVTGLSAFGVATALGSILSCNALSVLFMLCNSNSSAQFACAFSLEMKYTLSL